MRSATSLEPTGRLKTDISIIAKLLRQWTMKLSQMQDIAGWRVVVSDILKQDQVVERLSKAFGPKLTAFESERNQLTRQLESAKNEISKGLIRKKIADIDKQLSAQSGSNPPQIGKTERSAQKVKVYDRRKKPSHGYRAVHVIATAQGRLVEIQVRTELQHLWAEQSEVMSDTDSRIKYGGGDPDALELLSTNSKWIADIEGAEEDVANRKARLLKLLKSLNDIFESVRRAN